MRIIAGTKKGMKLFSPRGDISRPILDRVKESFFSVLYKWDLPEGKRVADVFSGVGSMGLEALSRGAEMVTFVEKDMKIAQMLKRNIEKADFVEQSRVLRSDAFSAGATVVGGRKYDAVFIDPPYPLTRDVSADSRLASMLEVVSMQVTDEAIVTVRTHKQVDLMERYGRFELLERRVWGNMAICFLRLSDE
jgi:16S rRNA (guanine(966)-N(2))-methyltransferase RsmD